MLDLRAIFERHPSKVDFPVVDASDSLNGAVGSSNGPLSDHSGINMIGRKEQQCGRRELTSKNIPARTCNPALAAAVEARLSASQSKPRILIALKPELFALLAKSFHFVL